MDASLKVTHTKTANGKPLCTLHNLPGLDAELTPDQLFKLAFALMGAAFHCKDRIDHPNNGIKAIQAYNLK